MNQRDPINRRAFFRSLVRGATLGALACGATTLAAHGRIAWHTSGQKDICAGCPLADTCGLADRGKGSKAPCPQPLK